ncbi:mlr5716 [Mesorhizobium japonicum MAFF 303099]|uniref:Mlr5716 protein n=1 Tax=Mesorhizobium japonicum (strain LMG 29417 / CECT 9101 / MAFF 303099) TaxID=266835 RepID=Q98B61_RHILO|nr:mlr5716 [Mesorhizobium japonicum MAFF 303099]
MRGQWRGILGVCGKEEHLPSARGSLAGAARRQLKQVGAVLLAALDIADNAEPSGDVRTLQPAARVDGKVAGERLDVPDMPLAEAHGRGAEEVLLRGKQRIGGVAVLMPGDDRHGLLALDQRVRPAFLQIHHQIVIGDLAVLAGRRVFLRHPLGQAMKDILEIPERCCACSHFTSCSPGREFALRVRDHQANRIR